MCGVLRYPSPRFLTAAERALFFKEWPVDSQLYPMHVAAITPTKSNERTL